MDYFTAQLEKAFPSLEWHEVYSYIEFLLGELHPYEVASFTQTINDILDQEGMPYTIKDGAVISLMSEEEASEVSLAEDRGGTAGTHIKRAVELFNQRPEPDYSNAIKEAISAVEAKSAEITGNPSAVLSDSVKKLGLHPALEQGITKLYAWTSDEGGIRHSLKPDGTTPTQAEARYILVHCAALVNYLTEKS